MAILEILEVPDPRLKQVSVPVEKFDDELRTLVSDMFETMYDAPGIGLAAIQVGVPLRVLVIDLQPDDPDAEPVACAHDGHAHHHQPTKREPQVFINPEILDPSEEQAAGSERKRHRETGEQEQNQRPEHELGHVGGKERGHFGASAVLFVRG